jgi:hypothetical protein
VALGLWRHVLSLKPPIWADSKWKSGIQVYRGISHTPFSLSPIVVAPVFAAYCACWTEESLRLDVWI